MYDGKSAFKSVNFSVLKGSGSLLSGRSVGRLPCRVFECFLDISKILNWVLNECLYKIFRLSVEYCIHLICSHCIGSFKVFFYDAHNKYLNMI